MKTQIYIQTPVLESIVLSKKYGKNIFLKMESAQPVGSFKIRGISNLFQKAVNLGATRFVASSGGNAGYAAAHAGRILGTEVTVVVPKTTQIDMREKIASEGATVIVHGDVWDKAHEHALALVQEYNAVYVPPFEHPDLWDGHATLIDEAAQQMLKPNLVVLSVGGGGLLCGVAQGMEKNHWQDVPILAVETHGAASFAAACRAGKTVELECISSIAKSLGALKVSDKTLWWKNRRPIVSHLVSDHQTLKACRQFLTEHRTLVEPACGASLAALNADKPLIKQAKKVLVIVCGGADVSLAKIDKWEQEIIGQAC